MNLNKTLGRVATTLVAGAMLTALAMPAYAEEDYTYKTGDTFTITKYLTVPANVFTPDVTFEFTVSAPTSATGTIDDMPVEAGKAGDITMESGADFNPETDVTDVAEARTKNADATFKVKLNSYTHAGVYKYSVSEDTSDPYEGVTYTTETKDLYVFVQNVTDDDGTPVDNNGDDKTDLTVAYTMLVEAGQDATNPDYKSDSFTNNYASDTDPDAKVYNLTLTEKLMGNAANMGGFLQIYDQRGQQHK